MSNKPPESVVHDAPQGAIYEPIHAKREVTVYPIQEHELKTLTVLNTQVSLWCSIGSVAIALLASCVWDMTMASAGFAFSRGAIGFVVICAVVASTSFYLAWKFKKDRNDELLKIKSEVVPPERQSPPSPPPPKATAG